MNIDSTKCKPHNNQEVLFQCQVNEAVIEAVKLHNLPITHIRWGRQVKAWGSTSAADYHVYHYTSDAAKKEFWVNMHNMEGYTKEDLVWNLLKGCYRFVKTEAQHHEDVTDADVTAYRLQFPKRGFTADKKFKKLKAHLAAKLFADKVTGLKKAFT